MYWFNEYVRADMGRRAYIGCSCVSHRLPQVDHCPLFVQLHHNLRSFRDRLALHFRPLHGNTFSPSGVESLI